MIQAIILGIVFVLGGLGGINLIDSGTIQRSPLLYDGINAKERLEFGATNFPTSLDSLTNPGATDSVATVSHSGQHSNANDAIEAIEAKLGIGASTPVTDSIFVGDGTGTSRFSTFATSTRFSATNFYATGSSTLQNFTAVNGTTTNATSTTFSTTKLVSTNATTTTLNVETNASTTNLFGAGLTSCSGSNFLQWGTDGKFSCGAGATSVINYVATTSTVDLATTTIRSIPEGERLTIRFYLATSTTNANLYLCFNEDWGGCKGTNNVYHAASSKDGGAIGTDASDGWAAILGTTNTDTGSKTVWGTFEVFNSTSTTKLLNGQMTYYSKTGGISHFSELSVEWASTTAAINQISFSHNNTDKIGLGSFFYIEVANP